ncbi:hypothetical protein [Algivirga pacifica]|uniref:Cell division protein FtsQ n=1 Tax=Algivirga pacifica TaxID=1162670 RepID=A0ABP9D2Q9_9BACT
MENKKIYIKGAALSLMLLIMVGIGGYALYEKKETAQAVGMIINIENKHESHFINDSEVREIIQQTGLKLNKDNALSLKALEDKLIEVDFIKRAEVAQDLKGNLVVDVYQDRPIARVVAQNGRSAYINQEKEIIPLSSNYTARVLLLTGRGVEHFFEENFMQTPAGQQLFELVSAIYEDEFWRLQIAHLELDNQLNMKVFTQVGKELIEFGTAEDYQTKLHKLKVFYEQIIPKKGWNYYKTIKLQYKDQIICK